MHQSFPLFGILVCLTACTHNLNSALGTLKNPHPTLVPPPTKENRGLINPFVQAYYNILLEATDLNNNNRTLRRVETDNMKRYVSAGFALSDYYCEEFFRDADESQRRRRFGRSATNDAGTALTAVLGLANAGQKLVTGVATGFGLGDTLWRNYDDAFVVNADLANVKALVQAAKVNSRQRTFAKDVALPEDYGTAQSVIIDYSNLCSTLGMKGLLNTSTDHQRAALNQEADKISKDGVASTVSASAPAAAPTTNAISTQMKSGGL